MNKLKSLRESRGLTQDGMANIIGVSIPSYSKKESGMIRFSLDEAKKLADYFEMPIEAIFYGNEVSKIETQRGLHLNSISKSR